LKEWPDTKAAQMAQARLAPDAPPAVKLTLRRRAVNLTSAFLDTWFGLQRLLEAVLPPVPEETGVTDEPLDVQAIEATEAIEPRESL